MFLRLAFNKSEFLFEVVAEQSNGVDEQFHPCVEGSLTRGHVQLELFLFVLHARDHRESSLWVQTGLFEAVAEVMGLHA